MHYDDVMNSDSTAIKNSVPAHNRENWQNTMRLNYIIHCSVHISTIHTAMRKSPHFL